MAVPVVASVVPEGCEPSIQPAPARTAVQNNAGQIATRKSPITWTETKGSVARSRPTDGTEHLAPMTSLGPSIAVNVRLPVTERASWVRQQD